MPTPNIYYKIFFNSYCDVKQYASIAMSDFRSHKASMVPFIIFFHSFRKWNKVENIALVTDAVSDVAFAPNLGRSYHLLGIATKTLKIISIEPLR